MSEEKKLADPVFAAERSHRDVQSAYEFAKTLCQMLLAINGVAITALLAYSGSDHKAFLLPAKAVGIAIFIFCIGVFFAVAASLAFLEHAQFWGGQMGKRISAADERHHRKARKTGRAMQKVHTGFHLVEPFVFPIWLSMLGMVPNHQLVNNH